MSSRIAGRNIIRKQGAQFPETETRQTKRPSSGIKSCPRCGATLFDDMGTCYGCLYDFSHDGIHRVQQDNFGRGPEGVGEETDLMIPWDDDDVWDDDEETGTDGPLEPTDSGGADATVSLELQPHHRDAQPAHMSREFPAYSLRICSEGMTVTCPIPERGLAIGRGPDNDVILTTKVVSRHHVRVFPSHGGALVEDQGATNGCLLNGAPLKSRGKLDPAAFSTSAGRYAC